MEAAAEELEVVRDDDERPDRDEGEQPRLVREAPAMPTAAAPASETTASADERRVAGCASASGRPFSSSSAWAADPDREKEAASRASRPSVEVRRKRGADHDVREVPGVYGGCSSVT